MSDDELRRVRRAARRLTAATDERDSAVAAAVAAGHSTRTVGEAAGMSHVGVQKIVARITD